VLAVAVVAAVTVVVGDNDDVEGGSGGAVSGVGEGLPLLSPCSLWAI